MGAGGITVVTTGMLPMVLLVAAVLSAPVALLLLWLYRRAVLRAMATTNSAAMAPPPDGPGTAGASAPLRVRRIEATAEAADSSRYRSAWRSLAALGAVQLAGGVAYALVFAAAWMSFSGGEGFVPARFAWLALCYGWPSVIAIGIAASVSRGQRIAVAGGYFAVLALVAGYALVRNAEVTAGQLVYFWLYVNAAPSLLLAAFLHRRVRAVGPLVATFMVAAVAGSQVLLSLVGASERGMRLSVEAGALWGLGGTEVFFALILAGFCLFGLAGWWLLKRLGSRYRARAMSDQTLTLDAMWLGFGIVQSITLSFEGWAWLFTGVVAFGVYKVVTLTGFGLLRTGAGERGTTLLLLRVFSLGRRSERLFDALSKQWLRLGSMTLIAGPDLVTSTVEPHEFLEFVGGALSRRFVRDGDDLTRRIEAMAHGPDPDGRYRVNEFLCYADTWQQTMQRLAAGADAVLMDLRSFTPGNRGCVFEIEQLLAGADLRRVLLLVDETTDEAFLERVLQQAWARGVGQAGAERSTPAEVRVLRLAGHAARDLRALLRLLLAEDGPSVPAPAGSVVAT